jgi:hypothetical protein
MNKSEMLKRAKFHKHNDRMVLFLNFANLDIEDAYEVIDYSAGIIERMPKSSICTLTNIVDAKYNQELINALRKFAQKNKPHVIAGAVIGVEGIKKTVFNALLKVSGRKNLKMFSNEDDALKWLLVQKRS